MDENQIDMKMSWDVLIRKLDSTMALKLRQYIEGIPKAELHLHIEGTLEPELMLRIAERNGISVEGTAESHRQRREDFKVYSSYSRARTKPDSCGYE